MLDTLKSLLPAWAFILISMVISSVLIGLITWQATGDSTATIIAVLSGLIGPGIVGARAIKGNDSPPTDPTATAPVTP
jgi:hypothetical protein